MQPNAAFSCGARSAFKLKEKGYLRSMLSRRQLQGFVGPRSTSKTFLESQLFTNETPKVCQALINRSVILFFLRKNSI